MRIKNFDCHFESYALVNNLTANLSPKIRRVILNAELLDIAHWLEIGRRSEYKDSITYKVGLFISEEDTASWNSIMQYKVKNVINNSRRRK